MLFDGSLCPTLELSMKSWSGRMSETAVTPWEDGRVRKCRWCSTQKPVGATRMPMWKRSLEHGRFSANWMVNNEQQIVQQ
jgi:hypothetical protein